MGTADISYVVYLCIIYYYYYFCIINQNAFK